MSFIDLHINNLLLTLEYSLCNLEFCNKHLIPGHSRNDYLFQKGSFLIAIRLPPECRLNADLVYQSALSPVSVRNVNNDLMKLTLDECFYFRF